MKQCLECVDAHPFISASQAQMESKAAGDIPECGECGRPWTADVGRHRRAVYRGMREFICDSC